MDHSLSFDSVPTLNWISFSPSRAVVNETVEYEFMGFRAYASVLKVKLSLDGSCTDVVLGGEEREADSDRKAAFTLSS